MQQCIRSNMDVACKLIDNNMIMYKRMVNYIANNNEVIEIINKSNGNKLKKYEAFRDTQELYKITSAISAIEQVQIPVHIVKKDRISRFSTTNYYQPIYLDGENSFYELLEKDSENVHTKVHHRIDGEQLRDTVMVIGKAIVDPETKKIIGYVFADVYDSYFDNIIKGIAYLEYSNNYILDQNGTIITDEQNKNLTGFKFKSEDSRYIADKEGKFNIEIDNKKYIVYFKTANQTGFKVLEAIPRNYIFYYSLGSIKYFVLLLFIIIFVAAFLNFNITRKMSMPILELKELTKKVQKGNFDVYMQIQSEDEMGELADGFNNMVCEIKRLIQEDYKKELLIKQAEFSALKSQVNPHFLYNTLGTVTWMARLGEVNGVIETTEALANFYRYSVKSNIVMVKVSEELFQVKSYLTIQKYRYRDKFNIEIIVDDSILNNSVMKFLLQPLVENAIIHGLEKKVGKGILIINGYKEKNDIIFEIIDNGIGLGESKSLGEGVGTENLRKRIDIIYGEKYGLRIFRKNELTVAQVKVKIMEDENGQGFNS